MILETSNDVKVRAVVIRSDGSVVRLHLLVAAHVDTGSSDTNRALHEAHGRKPVNGHHLQIEP
jgi:hypothetical protein